MNMDVLRERMRPARSACTSSPISGGGALVDGIQIHSNHARTVDYCAFAPSPASSSSVISDQASSSQSQLRSGQAATLA